MTWLEIRCGALMSFINLGICLLYVALLAVNSASAQSQGTRNAFDWMTTAPDLSSNVCKTVPDHEMIKYAACEFTYSLRIERPVPKDDEFGLGIFARSTTWDWLAVRPLVNCESLRETEAMKFGCQSEADDAVVLASTMLLELKDWRGTFAERFKRLEEQRAALEQASNRIARPDQLAQLDDLANLELALQKRQSQAELIAEAAKLIVGQHVVGIDLTEVRFSQVIEETVFTSESGRLRRTVSPGDIVLVLSEEIPSRATALHVDHGLGSIALGSLTTFHNSNGAAR